MATGRHANTWELGLESCGIQMEGGHIKVGQHLANKRGPNQNPKPQTIEFLGRIWRKMSLGDLKPFSVCKLLTSLSQPLQARRHFSPHRLLKTPPKATNAQNSSKH
eukprot:6316042-Amphidinium_carterae.1